MQRTVKIRLPGLIAALLLGVVSMAPAVAVEFDGTKLVLEQYYLHGGDLDQVDKFTGDQPTFDQEAPTGDDASVQVASGLNLAADDAAAYWVGAFEGTLRGDVEFTFSYTGGGVSTFRVFADNTRIGNRAGVTVPFSLDVDDPGELTVTIPLDGTVTVTEALRIEIRPQSAWEHMPVYYDSQDTDSGFVLPTIVPCMIDPSDPDCS